MIPTYVGAYGGWSGRTQYTYDGLDIRAKDLRPYIMASGDPDAIQNFNAYMRSRYAGGWLIAGGIVTSIIGLSVGLSNDRTGEANRGPYTPNGTVINGMMCYGYCNPTPDRTNHGAVTTGVAMFLGGFLISATGAWMLRPGQRMRQAVQYYNRSLRQRQGISWQVQPYSNLSISGVGLVGRF